MCACVRIQEDHEDLLDPILAVGPEIYLRRIGKDIVGALMFI